MKKAKTPPRRRSTGAEATIRMLRQQLKNAMASNHALQLDRSDKEKVIAGYDVQISEVHDELLRLQTINADQARSLGHHRQALRATERNLAFLEGYYAKSKEAIPATQEIQPGADFGDPRSAAIVRTSPQGAWLERGAEGLARTASDALRMQQAAPETHSRRYAVPKRDFPAFASSSTRRQADTDPGSHFGLTAEEVAALDVMKQADHADNPRTIRPRTPYRGTDGPLL